MKKLFAFSFLGLVGLILPNGKAAAWCHDCACNRGCMTICLRQYNAFTPVATGNICMDSCMPAGFHFYQPPGMNGGFPGCYGPNCNVGGSLGAYGPGTGSGGPMIPFNAGVGMEGGVGMNMGTVDTTIDGKSLPQGPVQGEPPAATPSPESAKPFNAPVPKPLDNQSSHNLANPQQNGNAMPYAMVPQNGYRPMYSPGYNPGYNPAYYQGYNPGYNPAYNPGYNQAYNPNYNPANMPQRPFQGYNGYAPTMPTGMPYGGPAMPNGYGH